MKTWKDYPSLFANGKFYGLNDRKEKFLISGCIASEEFYLLGATSYRATDCTLIARRIEDMTDEERNIYNNKRIANVMGGSTESPESFLYLLSIGILPKQFETDNVIFTNERDLENGSRL